MFEKILIIKIRLLLSCAFASWLETGKSRATTGRAEESGLSETSSLHDLFCWAAWTMSTEEQGLMAPGLLPVYNIMEIADGKDKKEWRKGMWWELGVLSEATQEICGFQVSQTLAPVEGLCWFQWLCPQEVNSKICELSVVTQVSPRSDIIIHQLLVERVHSDFAGKNPYHLC